MRYVRPKTRLIAHPKINWVEIEEYLKGIGGQEWYERQSQDAFAALDHSDGESLIEFGGRLCYRSWTEGLNPNVKRVRRDSAEYFDNLLASGHGSVLEHANYSFLFENVSRVFTHELVRHRAGAAYSQESMRFVRLTDIPFWMPEWTKKDDELVNRCLVLLKAMQDHQIWMSQHFGLDNDEVPFSEKKAKTSFMRRFAPDGVATSIIATFNIRALRHIIAMRTDTAAEEEIRIVFGQVAEIMQKECPLLFGDFESDDNGKWTPTNWKI